MLTWLADRIQDASDVLTLVSEWLRSAAAAPSEPASYTWSPVPRGAEEARDA